MPKLMNKSYLSRTDGRTDERTDPNFAFKKTRYEYIGKVRGKKGIFLHRGKIKSVFHILGHFYC